MKREKDGELTADAWRTQKRGRGGGMKEKKGGRRTRGERRRVIEREREERCGRNGEEMGRMERQN